LLFQAYVACELGPQWIGYTIICFGVVNTLAALVNGVLAKYLGRPCLFVIAFFVNAGLLVLLILWSPNKDQFIVFFIIPGAWAVGDAIWQTQTNGKLDSFNFKNSCQGKILLIFCIISFLYGLFLLVLCFSLCT